MRIVFAIGYLTFVYCLTLWLKVRAFRDSVQKGGD